VRKSQTKPVDCPIWSDDAHLTLAVCLLYVWLLRIGRQVIKAGQRAWVDRNDRRDLSLFQIGLRTIDRKLRSLRPSPFRYRPRHFCRVARCTITNA
jgi:hypothetical protein